MVSPEFQAFTKDCMDFLIRCGHPLTARSDPAVFDTFAQHAANPSQLDADRPDIGRSATLASTHEPISLQTTVSHLDFYARRRMREDPAGGSLRGHIGIELSDARTAFDPDRRFAWMSGSLYSNGRAEWAPVELDPVRTSPRKLESGLKFLYLISQNLTIDVRPDTGAVPSGPSPIYQMDLPRLASHIRRLRCS